MSRYFVTGSTGVIGGRVAQMLREAGHEVATIVRDGVFHIAGWYKLGVRDPSEGERVNVRGTRTVLTLMRDLGIAKGVYTSTLAVHGDTLRARHADPVPQA